MIRDEKNRITKRQLSLLHNIKNLDEFYAIKHLLLFGSFATGTATSLSDLDLAYISTESLSMKKEADLLFHLNSTLDTEEIDLINFNNAPLSLQYKILAEGKLIFSKSPDEIALLKEIIFPLYFDFLPFQKEYLTELEKNIIGDYI